MALPPPHCYVGKGKKAGRFLAELFAEGAGGRMAADRSVLSPAGTSVFWGISDDTRGPYLEAEAGRRPWLYMDHCYVGPRGTHYRITRSARQVSLAAPGLPPDLARLRALGVRPRDWRRPGDFILICPPGAQYLHLTGQDITPAQWLRAVERRVRAASDRPVRVRFKPLPRSRVVPFINEVALAWCVVTHQSVTAVEAIMAGVPAFVTAGDAAAAAGMALTDLDLIEQPRRDGDRERWAAWLAANQFTRAEIEAGVPWRALAG